MYSAYEKWNFDEWEDSGFKNSHIHAGIQFQQ